MERNIINPKRLDEWYSSLTIDELEAVFGEEFEPENRCLSFEDWCDSRWDSLTAQQKEKVYCDHHTAPPVTVRSQAPVAATRRHDDEGVMTPVDVVVSVRSGIGIHVTGLEDVQTREVLLRATTALVSCGYAIPGRKIVISIVMRSGAGVITRPADLDLAVAVALAACSGQCAVSRDALERTVIAGELGLDGSVRNNIGELQASTLTQAVTMLEKHQVQP